MSGCTICNSSEHEDCYHRIGLDKRYQVMYWKLRCYAAERGIGPTALLKQIQETFGVEGIKLLSLPQYKQLRQILFTLPKVVE